MHAEYFPINEGRNWQIVEQICEESPHVRVLVLFVALIIESVNLGDRARLVIAAQ